VIVKVCEAELPAASVAVTVTVVVPVAKLEPDAGLLVTVTFAQLSVADGLKLTTAEHAPASVTVLMLGRGAIAGGELSDTVNVVVQLAELFAASVAVTVIVVVPKPMSVPAAGLCDKVTAPLESSDAVTPPSKSGT
jgi:hypothetical protein